MKRWHEELTISRREWRKHRRSHVESNKNSPYGLGFGFDRIGQDPYEVDCPCDDQVGRFRKKDAWDCGNSRCYLEAVAMTIHVAKRVQTLQYLEVTFAIVISSPSGPCTNKRYWLIFPSGNNFESLTKRINQKRAIQCCIAHSFLEERNDGWYGNRRSRQDWQ